MANYNKVLLIGNLTRDPQLSYLPSQTPVVEVGLAVNRRWRGQDGEQREDTCFVDCRAYGRQAEVLNQYMSKGEPIFVEGRLDLDTWEGKDGQKRSKHRVTIERFQMLGSLGGSRQGGGGGGGRRQQQPAGRGAPQQQQQQQQQQEQQQDSWSDDEPPPPDDMGAGGDDIPF